MGKLTEKHHQINKKEDTKSYKMGKFLLNQYVTVQNTQWNSFTVIAGVKKLNFQP